MCVCVGCPKLFCVSVCCCALLFIIIIFVLFLCRCVLVGIFEQFLGVVLGVHHRKMGIYDPTRNINFCVSTRRKMETTMHTHQHTHISYKLNSFPILSSPHHIIETASQFRSKFGTIICLRLCEIICNKNSCK